MPLQSRFLSQLDLHSANLLRVFAKRSGQQGKKLKDLADSLTDDGNTGREMVIKGLCMYLSEDPEDLVQEYMDTNEANSLSAIEGSTVGIYVARETPSSAYTDVGVILEAVVVLQDLENVALATAMMLGLFYALNMRYPIKLCYTFEVLQKVMMELEASELSRKAESLKTKIHQ